MHPASLCCSSVTCSPACSLVAPREPGASPVSVPRGLSPRTPSAPKRLRWLGVSAHPLRPGSLGRITSLRCVLRRKLLGAGRLLRVEPGPRQPAVLLSTWQIALPRHDQLDAAGHPPCIASAETGARHAPLLHYRVVAPEAETRRPVTRLALQGQVSPHAAADRAEPGGAGPRLRHGPSRGQPRAVTREVELSRRSLELTRHHVVLRSPAVHFLSPHRHPRRRPEHPQWRPCDHRTGGV